ncbi:agmatinase [Desulfobacca acetoxidans]|uniref:Agmatinase n=1 Tax=Desulfobacca acetoxidans (strain ATCC 700848 / DSM 11109 / ASRB2) TaxID=880072 RepID=F2NGJ0_DESAR|nr:agmatinase [Desulfobacca acetoxidans]AEB08603.1 agmatinase [Desulfobacca acetoxidans DSM 11109]
MPSGTFLDLEPISVREAEIVVVPIPYEATTSYGGGTRYGPEAILSASRQVELWDEEGDWDPSQVIRLATAAEITPDAGGPGPMLEKIKKRVKPWIAEGKLLISLGGEHTIAQALVESYLTRHPDLTVVALDAHADLRDTYEHSPFSHACVMRRVWELGRPLTLIGVRSYSAKEYDFIRVAPRLTLLKARSLVDPDYLQLTLEHLRRLKGPVYISLDVDALDPAVMPATGTPEPGGLNYYQTLTILKAIVERGPVVGLDLTELAPIPGHRVSEFTAARLIYKFLGYLYQGRRAAK